MLVWIGSAAPLLSPLKLRRADERAFHGEAASGVVRAGFRFSCGREGAWRWIGDRYGGPGLSTGHSKRSRLKARVAAIPSTICGNFVAQSLQFSRDVLRQSVDVTDKRGPVKSGASISLPSVVGPNGMYSLPPAILVGMYC